MKLILLGGLGIPKQNIFGCNPYLKPEKPKIGTPKISASGGFYIYI